MGDNIAQDRGMVDYINVRFVIGVTERCIGQRFSSSYAFMGVSLWMMIGPSEASSTSLDVYSWLWGLEHNVYAP